MSLSLIDGEEFLRRIPIPVAIAVLQRAFERPPPPGLPQRTGVEVPGGELLLMPAAGPTGVGVKLVTLAPSNPGRGLPFVQASYVLFEPNTLSPEAIIDGTTLTTVRTAAVSGLATRLLALPDATRLVLFGAGVMATAHLEAMLAVRPFRSLRVVSRSSGPAEELAARARESGLDAAVAGPDAVTEADVICTCTTSPRPVFDGRLVPKGAHVNAIGSYQPETRELDDETIRRARVVVETREAALAEAGDLLIPISAGVIGPEHIESDLSELVRGAKVRRGPEDVTVFKSVGIAWEDLAVARAVVDAGP
ncbi:MAG TPA: ornithine cyclodeaminase family protein [Actinomycetota bacterium]|nr:ornithine cyclodeaminase family protein [Actinomycetota bacterium]